MSSSSASSSPSSSWQLSYIRPGFSTCIRKFLRSKTAGTEGKAIESSEQNCISAAAIDADKPSEEEDSVPLQRAVKRLHFGGLEEKKAAAFEIERLAREDVKVKKLMAELRVIPALVDMVAAAGQRREAVGALLELASGTYT